MVQIPLQRGIDSRSPHSTGDSACPETLQLFLKRTTKDSAKARRANEVRNQSGRRRLIDPTTCERDYSAVELEFMRAMQEYKVRSGRMFPTWSEVLEVLRSLGYEQHCSASEAAR